MVDSRIREIKPVEVAIWIENTPDGSRIDKVFLWPEEQEVRHQILLELISGYKLHWFIERIRMYSGVHERKWVEENLSALRSCQSGTGTYEECQRVVDILSWKDNMNLEIYEAELPNLEKKNDSTQIL